ncbi:MAG: TonB-dependent receptor [Proteobacteria bacterium]|nr:TonB-dependent receptor [Pseudomonadota bacterium]
MSCHHRNGLAALLIAAALPAYGQPAGASGDEVRLPTVSITGQAAPPVDLAPPTVLQPGAGQTFTRLNDGQWANQPAKSIGDILLLSPGVTITQGNGPRDISVSIRGSNVRQTFGIRNIVVFEDGFPVTQPDGLSRTDLADPHAYSGIDVVRGPSSALYGNYATGGALFFNTVPGRDIQGLHLGSDGGSFGYTNNYGSVGFAGKDYQFSLFGSNVRGDGFITNSRYNTSTANLLASYDITPNDRLTLKIIHNSLDTQVPIRLSLDQYNRNPFQAGCGIAVAAGCGSVALLVNGKNGIRVAQTASQAELGRHDERNIFGARWEHVFDADTVWRTQFVFDSRTINQPTGTTSAVGPFNSVNLMSFVTHRQEIAGFPTLTTFGFAFNDMRIDSHTYNVMPAGAIGALTQTVGGHQLNYGARAATEVTLTPEWALLLALGWENSQINANQNTYAYPTAGGTTVTNIPAFRTFTNVAPSVAVIYTPIEEVQIHTRVSTGYGTPQYSNLFVTPQGVFGNNTQLKPQKNVGIDIGPTFRLTDQLTLDITGFYEFFQNELVSQSAGANLQTYTFNAPASQHRGIEIGGTYRPLPQSLPGASLYLAYIYDNQIYTSYVEQLSNATKTASFNRAGNKIPGVPPNQLLARASYRQPDGPLAGVGGYIETIFRGAAYFDNANLLQVPSYAIVNLGVNYDPAVSAGPLSAMRIYFSVQNLLNTTYIASASNLTNTINAAGVQNGAASVAATTGSIYAGSPRAFYGGVKLYF